MLRASAKDLLEVTRLDFFSQRAKAVERLTGPLLRASGVIQTPGRAGFTRLGQARKIDSFKLRQRRQRRGRRHPLRCDAAAEGECQHPHNLSDAASLTSDRFEFWRPCVCGLTIPFKPKPLRGSP